MAQLGQDFNPNVDSGIDSGDALDQADFDEGTVSDSQVLKNKGGFAQKKPFVKRNLSRHDPLEIRKTAFIRKNMSVNALSISQRDHMLSVQSFQSQNDKMYRDLYDKVMN